VVLAIVELHIIGIAWGCTPMGKRNEIW